MKKGAIALGILWLASVSLWSQTTSIRTKTAGMKAIPGFFNLYWDEKAGSLWLEVDRIDEDFLYLTTLPAGLGSYDARLDRGQDGAVRVVRFQRIGPKLLLVQSNDSFRGGPDPFEKKLVEDSFARAVLWGFEIAAEENGRILVDAGRFFLRDAYGAADALRRRNQGTFIVDASRSAFHLPAVKSFPSNTEIEVLLTMTCDNPGGLVRGVAADPEAIMLREHHSFIRLPDDGFKPRAFDPRADYQIVRYMDFSAPTEQPIVKRLIYRHRLEKKNPQAAVSDPVNPIIYYVDRGVPEPIRSALMEGAGWWNEAFEALGYRNAFQVQILPEDADPMDIRYNMIVWVPRSTRGYCFGGSVVDPRTGEILKAQVTFDALTIRQDYLIAQAVAGDFDKGRDNSKELLDLALASIRQMCCHEVGHTLGPEHNFAGSINNRASAMDYPAPLIKLRPDGTLDLSDAYAKGIGEWDKVLIAYGYKDFPAGTDETAGLRATLDGAFSRGLLFLASDDIPMSNWQPSNAQPLVARWDNGSDPVAELDQIIKVRAAALASFSEKRIRPGEPMATLEEVLVPAYLYHRYQVEAAAGVLGGQYYYHRLRGDVQKNPEIVPAADQRRALDAMLRTIAPVFLALDPKIVNLIPARPAKYGQTVELFPGYTGQTFDPLAAAETAAHLTIRMILQPSRVSRLVDFHARNPECPGPAEVIDKLIEATWKAPENSDRTPHHAEIRRVVDDVVLNYLMRLAVDEKEASPQARAVAMLKLADLGTWLESRPAAKMNEDLKAHDLYGRTQIELFLKNPKGFPIPQLLPIPAGGPI